MSNFSLHDYQKTGSNEISKNLENYSSVLYQLPTGGGKTFVLQDLVDKNLDKKILILVHRREIIFQIKERLAKKGITAGVLIGSYQENIDSNILVASSLTVTRDTRLQIIIDRDFDILMIDEAHHACAGSYEKIIKRFKEHNPKFKLVGFTATPFRKDKKQLKDIFEILICGPSIPELQKQGYLSGAKTYAANIEELDDEVEKSGNDYNITSLSRFMRNDKFINYAISTYKTLAHGKQMLIFCVDKKHAKQVNEAYKKAGYEKIAHIDSDVKSSVRDKIIEDFKNKKIDIITSVETLTEGVNLPEANVIQLLRPTLSLVLYLQMVGRGLRPKQDKSDLIILDIANCSREHGLVDTERVWSLNQVDPGFQRKRNKVVGKRKNGTFTEDVLEIQDENLELVELSPEEFLMKNENGIEEAKKNNQEVINQIINVLNDVRNLLSEYVKDKNYKFIHNPIDESTSLYGILNKASTFYIKNDKLIKNSNFAKISLKKERLLFKDDYYSFGITDDNSWTNIYIALGELAKIFSTKSKVKKIIETWSFIFDLTEKLVNIDEIRSKINDFHKKQTEILIDNKIRNGQLIFKLKEGQEIFRYFRDCYSWEEFDTIEFLDNPTIFKLNSNIKFSNSKGSSYHHKTVKKDILIEIMNNKKICE